MKRLLLALCLCLVAGASATAATLRPSIEVEAEVVRIGDIWEGAGQRADVAIARAPQPGRRMVLDSRWLTEVAHAYGVAWRPMSRYDRTVVERASQIIDRERIVARIAAALNDHGIPADADIQLANGDLRIHLPVDAEPEFAVRDIDFDQRTRRFSATLETSDERVRVAGMVHAVTEVPVLVRGLGRGDLVEEGHLEWRRMRADRLPRDAVLDPERIVGQAARQNLRPGAVLRTADLQRPVIVAKGNIVTMVLRSAALTITAQGRAAEDGGDGDVIRVINSHSNLAVRARVEGPNAVSVMINDTIVMN